MVFEPQSLTSLSAALTVPLNFLLRCVRNPREANLLIQVGSRARHVERLLRHYEEQGVYSARLVGAWERVFSCSSPTRLAAVPLLGAGLESTAARETLMQQLMQTISTLHDSASELRWAFSSPLGMVWHVLQLARAGVMSCGWLQLTRRDLQLARADATWLAAGSG
ncbi:hypothetical protein CYMTET_16600 [Cymbomonas tetramitiformis]|uniref:Uncharacterized protein n=1 Tax=Cymbomonas tetramitiformis TaxID=36881 RepID=A0AAE0GBX1_9CHLO|nr:hypothetical protein CYMTET_16600 [Cymbomonas tetramitiformis]